MDQFINVDRMMIRSFKAGEWVFHEGDIGDCAYLVETGDDLQWKNSLVIKLNSELTDEEWDSIIEKTTETSKNDFPEYTLAHSIETLGSKNDCYSYALRILNALEYNNKTDNDLIGIAVDLIEPKLKELKLFSLVWNNINEENYWVRIKI